MSLRTYPSRSRPAKIYTRIYSWTGDGFKGKSLTHLRVVSGGACYTKYMLGAPDSRRVTRRQRNIHLAGTSCRKLSLRISYANHSMAAGLAAPHDASLPRRSSAPISVIRIVSSTERHHLHSRRFWRLVSNKTDSSSQHLAAMVQLLMNAATSDAGRTCFLGMSTAADREAANIRNSAAG